MNINENTNLIGFIVWLICSCNLGSITNQRNQEKIKQLEKTMKLCQKTITENFPSEIDTFQKWCHPIYLTIYLHSVILGWENEKKHHEMFHQISLYNAREFSFKEKIKLYLIKFKILDLWAKLSGK